jgi:hypothetical protein
MVYTIRQIVLHDKIFTDMIDPTFVVQHFLMSYDKIFTNICWIVQIPIMLRLHDVCFVSCKANNSAQ